MDLRKVRLAAKTIRVATAHYIAAAKVRVAQKPCQLRPGREETATYTNGDRSTNHMIKSGTGKDQASEGSNRDSLALSSAPAT